VGAGILIAIAVYSVGSFDDLWRLERIPVIWKHSLHA
jgi:hypothetical protein